MNLIFFTPNSYINPMVNTTFIKEYYKSNLVADPGNEDSKRIIERLSYFINPRFEIVVKEGLEKTFNIAKFGLNVFSNDIGELKKELEIQYTLEQRKWCTFSTLCLIVMTISSLAFTSFVALGLAWSALLGVDISIPLSLFPLLVGFTLSVITFSLTEHLRRYDLIQKSVEKTVKKADKRFHAVFTAIDNFDHDAFIARAVLVKIHELIITSALRANTRLNSKIFKLYKQIEKQFALRNTIKNIYHIM